MTREDYQIMTDEGSVMNSQAHLDHKPNGSKIVLQQQQSRASKNYKVGADMNLFLYVCVTSVFIYTPLLVGSVISF